MANDKLIKRENKAVSVTVSNKLKNPFQAVINIMNNKAAADEAIQLSAANVLAKIADMGKDLNTISNKEICYAQIAQLAMCKVSNLNNIYVVPFGASWKISVNYMEEERILNEYSTVFGSIKTYPILKTMEWGKDYTSKKDENGEFLIIMNPTDPTIPWTIEDVKAIAVEVSRKDGKTDLYWIKQAKLKESMSKSGNTKNTISSPVWNGAYAEDMILKTARRSVYKFYHLDLDAIANGAFNDFVNSDYDFDETTDNEKEAQTKETINFEPKEKEKIKPEIVEVKEKPKAKTEEESDEMPW